MIFDIHAHVGETKFGHRTITAETILRLMDAAGIDRAILLPTISTGRVMPAEKMRAEVAKAPDRLVGFALVNPKDPDAVRDFEEAVVTYGARGLKIHPVYMALAADDETWVYPLVEKARELNVPVMFHSGEPPFATPLADRAGGPGLSPGHDYHGAHGPGPDGLYRRRHKNGPEGRKPDPGNHRRGL